MTPGRFRFEGFSIDVSERRLRHGAMPVELNGRYFDALALLVREGGALVTKDRFMEEVWRGVPVTDEALTQCVRTLRRALGDEAGRPRFIETVPKHGYRFIAPVTWIEDENRVAAGRMPVTTPSLSRHALSRTGVAGTIGGGTAGVLGGLFYGLAGTAPPVQPGMGALSVLLVLLVVTTLLALIGGAGVSFGIAAALHLFGRGSGWAIVGGALGGAIVGAAVKLIGLDAFELLVGRSPGGMTGAGEGALLGGAVGLGAWLWGRTGALSVRQGAGMAALAGGVAGILIAFLGGRLMGGSLDLLARDFPASRFRLDAIGGLLREEGFGPLSQMATGALEGALFAGCVVGAMILAERRFGADQGVASAMSDASPPSAPK
ncbi:transcriptional regulator [Allosphingosinicella flava]|uniref:Transcriptional regulator n=1 Tax=Allosphingosinicella flava TaxID=2771430 RepID=A0A7T2LMN4_9SPHN|nr:transcriptional regulator [Sphingosinicella flava]QPQ55463.1 transcriptional regulator [Sphingosinicella flava]